MESSRFGRLLESVSNENNTLLLNMFNSIDLLDLHEVIFNFINDKDNQGKNKKYISAKSNNVPVDFIKDSTLIIVSGYYNKMNYLSIEFMIGTKSLKTKVASDVFTINLRYNSSTKSYEEVKGFNLSGSIEITKELEKVADAFNSKHYTIKIDKNQAEKLFK